ncbi:hypothetical protein U9M48_038869 [Paspalum notatum var. saurae]|uniref:Fe2OG dioxygenase domain-containing protein n=1 Tax=Paspalum notatum var. saurae TaxID=547442 RepID=A0AAQ3XCG8_PASNO
MPNHGLLPLRFRRIEPRRRRSPCHRGRRFTASAPLIRTTPLDEAKGKWRHASGNASLDHDGFKFGPQHAGAAPSSSPAARAFVSVERKKKTMMSQPSTPPFDLCPGHHESMTAKTIIPEGSMKRKAGEPSTDAASVQPLRPGMVLLKGFVKPEDQVEIIRKNWDLTTRSYGPTRPFDGAQVPAIPEALKTIAQAANSTVSEFPQIDPDLCIVNYYTNSGKLGLHQDKDESKSSINQGLPFISISISDTAKFMFGDTRDKGKATKIDLESGDVLILGGESRLLFHGISHVKTNITPTWLKEATGLRPGCINLTFRQY